ncbi:hypothetical protein KBP46_04510 [Chryseobacterium sp. PCH239]|uniref:hypothetical protein n=1 Tax=Chryseobacterium sp. PCH239 TaxID=2825845 RepID=UPI001C1240C2|nr:hypothetical protein [Chryseobacterium sp. PCH239]QWT87127.1 hypothetical protein KBP46_04510 [Chryseobacterium sp. PCH239]
MNTYFFRAGNFANNYGNENYIITEHDIKQIEAIDTVAFQPIPLSEKWLIKLGFTKIAADSNIIANYSKDVNIQEKMQITLKEGEIKEISLFSVNNFGDENWDSITSQSIFFTVHYLQNLMLDHAKPGYPFKR